MERLNLPKPLEHDPAFLGEGKVPLVKMEDQLRASELMMSCRQALECGGDLIRKQNPSEEAQSLEGCGCRGEI